MNTLIMKKLTNSIRLIKFRRTWRKINNHNNTTVKNVFPLEKVSVGKKTYGELYVKTYGNVDERLIIGSYCSIAGDVKFLLGGEHYYKGLSTFPFRKYICGLKENTLTKGPIVMKDDVWIGEGSLILSGVTIGQGAIIAAGSIVAKDIPPYAIYAGGRIIKYRFSDDLIDKLIKLDYEKLEEEKIKNNIELLYTDLEIEMLSDAFLKGILSEEE